MQAETMEHAIATSDAERLATLLEQRDVEAFLFREARLQDEHRYEEWEALWADDGVYWVPAGGDDIDPSIHISFIYDNRARLAGRIRQLKTGRRHSQAPVSRLRRVVSNVEIERAGDQLEVHSTFFLSEARHGRLHAWAGHTRHRLRRDGAGFRIVLKKVMLVDSDQAIPNLAFLI